MKAALEKIPEKIKELIVRNVDDLVEAWANCGGDPLTISFSAKIGFKKEKPICEVGISFVKEKIVDSVTFEWDNRQLDLKLKEAVDGLRPDGKDGIESVTISSGERSVTLEADRTLVDGEQI